MRVLKGWYQLARKVLKFLSLEVLKIPLAMTQENLLQLSLPESGALGRTISRGPFAPKLFCDTGQIGQGIIHGL